MPSIKKRFLFLALMSLAISGCGEVKSDPTTDGSITTDGSSTTDASETDATQDSTCIWDSTNWDECEWAP